MRDFLCNTSLSETFHLPVSTQALEETQDLQQKTMHVELLNPLTNGEWTCISGTNYYSANRFYSFYFKDIHAHQAYRWIWKSKATMKIKVFGWFLLSDRLNTRDMLKRRRYNIGNDFGCLLCTNCNNETVDHLFLECIFSLECWDKIQIMGHAAPTRLEWVEQAKISWNKPLFMEIFMLAA